MKLSFALVASCCVLASATDPPAMICDWYPKLAFCGPNVVSENEACRLAGVFDIGIKCSPVGTQDACVKLSPDCEWDADEGKCDVPPALAMAMMMSGGGAMAQIGLKSQECEALTQEGTCADDEDCEWKADESKCEINGMVAMAAMMGEGGAGAVQGAMMMLMLNAMACGFTPDQGQCEGHTQSDGTPTGCTWGPNDEGTGDGCTFNAENFLATLSPEIAELIGKSTACKSNDSETACGTAADCDWKTDGDTPECDVTDAVMMAALNPTQEDGGAGPSMMQEMQELGAVCGPLLEAECQNKDLCAFQGGSCEPDMMAFMLKAKAACPASSQCPTLTSQDACLGATEDAAKEGAAKEGAAKEGAASAPKKAAAKTACCADAKFLADDAAGLSEACFDALGDAIDAKELKPDGCGEVEGSEDVTAACKKAIAAQLGACPSEEQMPALSLGGALPGVSASVAFGTVAALALHY